MEISEVKMLARAPGGRVPIIEIYSSDDDNTEDLPDRKPLTHEDDDVRKMVTPMKLRGYSNVTRRERHQSKQEYRKWKPHREPRKRAFGLNASKNMESVIDDVSPMGPRSLKRFLSLEDDDTIERGAWRSFRRYSWGKGPQRDYRFGRKNAVRRRQYGIHDLLMKETDDEDIEREAWRSPRGNGTRIGPWRYHGKESKLSSFAAASREVLIEDELPPEMPNPNAVTEKYDDRSPTALRRQRSVITIEDDQDSDEEFWKSSRRNDWGSAAELHHWKDWKSFSSAHNAVTEKYDDRSPTALRRRRSVMTIENDQDSDEEFWKSSRRNDWRSAAELDHRKDRKYFSSAPVDFERYGRKRSRSTEDDDSADMVQTKKSRVLPNELGHGVNESARVAEARHDRGNGKRYLAYDDVEGKPLTNELLPAKLSRGDASNWRCGPVASVRVSWRRLIIRLERKKPDFLLVQRPDSESDQEPSKDMPFMKD